MFDHKFLQAFKLLPNPQDMVLELMEFHQSRWLLMKKLDISKRLLDYYISGDRSPRAKTYVKIVIEYVKYKLIRG